MVEIAIAVCLRFTPTGVGTAASLGTTTTPTAVHPHRRGDGLAVMRSCRQVYGSPPQAWGRLKVQAHRRGDGRFTPTGVGTAMRPGTSASFPSGSPPQAWGRQRAHARDRRRVRFTPTGVGTAGTSRTWISRSSVHPHRRGDGGQQEEPPTRPAGSPPQAWGRRPHGNRAGVGHRFTPTGVGTAMSSVDWPNSTPVHPHRRGDGRRLFRAARLPSGSPPQAWGRLPTSAQMNGRKRFTPTGVGTAAAPRHSMRSCSVHPHRRGDGDLIRRPVMIPRGSPPQAWGRRILNGAGSVGDGSPPQAWGRRSGCVSFCSVHWFTPTGVGTA